MIRMLDIRGRTRLRRMLYAKPVIIGLVFLVALLLRGVWGIYEKSTIALVKRDKAEEQLASLLAREKELQQDIARLSTGEGVEAEIRDRFMVAKEGEKVMIINSPKSESTHTVIVNDTPSFFEKMMDKAGFGGE